MAAGGGRPAGDPGARFRSAGRFLGVPAQSGNSASSATTAVGGIHLPGGDLELDLEQPAQEDGFAITDSLGAGQPRGHQRRGYGVLPLAQIEVGGGKLEGGDVMQLDRLRQGDGPLIVTFGQGVLALCLIGIAQQDERQAEAGPVFLGERGVQQIGETLPRLRVFPVAEVDLTKDGDVACPAQGAGGYCLRQVLRVAGESWCNRPARRRPGPGGR